MRIDRQYRQYIDTFGVYCPFVAEIIFNLIPEINSAFNMSSQKLTKPLITVEYWRLQIFKNVTTAHLHPS